MGRPRVDCDNFRIRYADEDWIYYGEDERANIHWCIGTSAECQEAHDNANGLEYEGDEAKGHDILHAPILHAAACVNALSSVPRPEKVGALLEACRALAERDPRDGMYEAIEAVTDAYAACMAEEERDG